MLLVFDLLVLAIQVFSSGPQQLMFATLLWCAGATGTSGLWRAGMRSSGAQSTANLAVYFNIAQ